VFGSFHLATVTLPGSQAEGLPHWGDPGWNQMASSPGLAASAAGSRLRGCARSPVAVKARLRGCGGCAAAHRATSCSQEDRPARCPARDEGAASVSGRSQIALAESVSSIRPCRGSCTAAVHHPALESRRQAADPRPASSTSLALPDRLLRHGAAGLMPLPSGDQAASCLSWADHQQQPQHHPQWCHAPAPRR
jgi:hypothetical protein